MKDFYSILIEFLSFEDPSVRSVVLGAIILGATSGAVGCFTFLRKKSLVGDAVAHAILPGVCLAFVISGDKNPLVLLVGAAFTGWLSLVSIDIITRYSKLKSDTAIGLVLSMFYGFGILFLTNIQHNGNPNQSGLDKFLFGKVASLTNQDIELFAFTGFISFLVILLFFKELKAVCFNPDFAQSIGLKVGRFEFLLSTITVLTVATGIQAVGVVLMAALLITPAATARFWTNKLGLMIFLAALIGAACGIFGSFISYSSPSMPTGPWIVVALSLIALASMFLAPKKGIIAKRKRLASNRKKILKENILKALYQLGEASGQFFKERNSKEINSKRSFGKQELNRGMNMLSKDNQILFSGGDRVVLTEKGFEESKRIVRLHRLWELYLTKRMQIQTDHVHHDAEAIEHIISPEIEAQIVEELNDPSLDPHEKEIPKPKIMNHNG